MPISTYNPGQKVLGHSLFFTCFVRNLQLTGNIATSSKLSIYREWTREWAAKPLAFAAPFACCSRVTSRDSPKWSACSQATGNTDHKQGLNKGRDPFNQNFQNFGLKLNGSVRSNRKSFEKTGPPFEVDHFSRSHRLEFWLNGSRPRFLPSSRTKIWPILWARFEKECLTSKTQHCPGGGRVNLNCNFLYMKDKVSQTFCPGLYFTSGINT